MNNLILPISTIETRTSLQFLSAVINPARVEFGETPHEPRHFLLKVEDELDLSPTVRKFRLNSNQTKSYYYDLNKEQMMLIGMRESKMVRRKVMEFIKNSSISSVPQSFAEALQLAADQAKQLELAAPKVAFVDKYVTADSGSKGFRQVAKLLNANEKDFRAFLSDSKIMYKLGGEWMPYQCHADAGRFEVKGGVADNDHVYNSALFTPKGINWVAGLWAQHCLKGSDTEY